MKKIKIKSWHVITALCVILLIMLCALSINSFIKNVQQNEIEIADKNLLVAANNGAAIIKAKLNKHLSTAQSLAGIVENEDDYTSEDVMTMLEKVKKINGYERLAIDFPNGETVTSDGLEIDVSDFNYTYRILDAEPFMTDVLPAKADGVFTVSFIAPIFDGLEPVAALRITMSTKELSKEINLTMFDSDSYYHLVDSNGQYVAVSESNNALLMDENFLDAVARLEYQEGYSVQQIYDCFLSGKPTYSKYSVGINERYAYCQSVGVNNWILMTIVPKTSITQLERQNIYFATLMTVQLGIILGLVFLYVYLLQRRSRKRAELNDKCFRALSEQTGKVIFEWDFESNQITSMTNFRAIFGRDMVTKSSASDALSKNIIHPKDVEIFAGIFRDILQGINVENIKFRISDSNGVYLWCLLCGVVIRDHRGKPYKAIGTLENIDEVINKEASLRQRSEKDLLTGLHNKTTTEFLIKAALLGEQKNCALVIIDIDNFKSVNDSLGHQYGDDVLKKLAAHLIPFVGENDVVGRIGGDEFFVFFNGYTDEACVYRNAEEICRLFTNTYIEGTVVCKISASIGISFYPRDGHDFDTLYKYADIALYRTKRTGKNGYTIYDNTLGDTIAHRTEIESPAENSSR